jgi:hypothetical protein
MVLVAATSSCRRGLNVDNHSMPGVDQTPGVDQIVEAVAKLDRLFAFAVHAEHGSTGEITFGSSRSVSGPSSSKLARNSLEARQELSNRASLTLRRRPVDLFGCLAVIAAGLYDG